MTEEEWTLPGALKDLTDAIRGLPDVTTKLEALTAELKTFQEILPKLSSGGISLVLEEGSRNRKALGDAVQEILKALKEAVEELKVKPLTMGGE